MMLRTGLLAVALCAIAASSAEGQFRRPRAAEVVPAPVYPPQYAQPYYTQPYYAQPHDFAQPVALPSTTTTHIVTAASSCACGAAPPCSTCTDVCQNPPRVVPNTHDCKAEIRCEPIAHTLTPLPKLDCKTYAFYGPAQKFQAAVEVPVIEETCTETWRFETIKVELPCCTVYVCVPCEKVFEKKRECREVRKQVDLESFRRRDGTIDVYVLNVPGLPTRYVQRQKLSEADYKANFPSAPVPTYP